MVHVITVYLNDVKNRRSTSDKTALSATDLSRLQVFFRNIEWH